MIEPSSHFPLRNTTLSIHRHFYILDISFLAMSLICGISVRSGPYPRILAVLGNPGIPGIWKKNFLAWKVLQNCWKVLESPWIAWCIMVISDGYRMDLEILIFINCIWFIWWPHQGFGHFRGAGQYHMDLVYTFRNVLVALLSTLT